MHPTDGGGVWLTVTFSHPMWFRISTDAVDSTRLLITVYPGFDERPDDEAVVAEVEVEEHDGPAVNALIHSSDAEALAALPADLREIVESVQAQIEAIILERS